MDDIAFDSFGRARGPGHADQDMVGGIRMHIYMSIEDLMLRLTEQSMVTLADSEYSSGRRVLLVLPSREQSLSEPPFSLIIDGTP